MHFDRLQHLLSYMYNRTKWVTDTLTNYLANIRCRPDAVKANHHLKMLHELVLICMHEVARWHNFEQLDADTLHAVTHARLTRLVHAASSEQMLRVVYDEIRVDLAALSGPMQARS